MRKRLALFVLVLAFLAPERPASAGVTISISTFYDELSPHGDWISTRHYGRCWRPARISRDWQPYLNGEWVYTDYGWTWVSSDPWGGDPYHYGTWDWEDDFGWYWIPGTIWAPAWVTWHYSDSTIGWAPVRPSFSLSSSGYSGPAITVSRNSYIFVPANQFVGVNVTSSRLPVSQNGTLLTQTRATTRFASTAGVLTSGGPSIRQVEQATRQSVPRVSVSDAHTTVRPVRESFQQGRQAVIAPAAERARFTSGQPGGPGRTSGTTERVAPQAAPERHAVANGRSQGNQVHEQKPAQRENRVQQRDVRAEPRADAAPQPSRHQGQPVQAPRAQPARPEEVRRAEPQRAQRAEPQRAEPQRVQRGEPQRPAPQRAEPAPREPAPREPARGQPAAPPQQGNSQGQGRGQKEEHGKDR